MDQEQAGFPVSEVADRRLTMRNNRVARCFGRRLKSWRLRTGLTLKRMAGHLGVSASIICAWEQAARFPNLGHLQRISSYTGMTIDHLLCERTLPVPEDFPKPEVLIEVDEDGVILDAEGLSRNIRGSSIFLQVDDNGQARLRRAFSKVRQTGRGVVGEIPFGPMARGAKWLSRVAPVAGNGSTYKFLVIAMDPNNMPLKTLDEMRVTERVNSSVCELSTHIRNASVGVRNFRKAMERCLDDRRIAELQMISDELRAAWGVLSRVGAKRPSPVEVFAAEENPPGDLPL
jgi:transcriptional regulator with XRE-family HTH domain